MTMLKLESLFEIKDNFHDIPDYIKKIDKLEKSLSDEIRLKHTGIVSKYLKKLFSIIETNGKRYSKLGKILSAIIAKDQNQIDKITILSRLGISDHIAQDGEMTAHDLETLINLAIYSPKEYLDEDHNWKLYESKQEKKVFTDDEISNIAVHNGFIDELRKYGLKTICQGFRVEQEHDKGDKYDVVNNPVEILKIALEHLSEDEKYYSKLKKYVEKG